MAGYVGAIDQGTTSSRFIIFDRQGRIVGQERKEHRQFFPKPGWVEHDPLEIWRNIQSLVSRTLKKTALSGSDLAAVGVTNQRETTVVWDKETGRPFCRAIVWQCARTHEICKKLIQEGGQDRFRSRTGLPVSTYFSGPKIKWILDRYPEARQAAARGKALFGTMETWIIWWLTGGPPSGSHVTDVTNAGRTLLMDIETLAWHDDLLRVMGVPPEGLPSIVPSSDSDTWGTTSEDGPFRTRIPVCGALGDQQAALVGQACFESGEAKNTYGTGCFVLMNTGTEPTPSTHGLLTTLAYQFRGEMPRYCLEGSIAVAGALVQWFRDKLNLIQDAAEIEDLARQVDDTAGVYIVPAFSGLLAPYWRPDARGVITGLTRYADKHHLARAVLEASAYQTRDIVQAMNKDSGIALKKLKVDGGMVKNELLMQFQADILDVQVIRPKVIETTSLGAAYAAGLAVGFWSGIKDLRDNWAEDKHWLSSMPTAERTAKCRNWQKAVDRSLGWEE